MGKQRKQREMLFTTELGDRVCDLLSQGNSVLAISKTKGMPSEA